MDDSIDVPDESTIQHRYHTDAIYSVAVSTQNPNIIATGGGDDVARLFDLSKEEVNPVVLGGHTDSVVQVQFSHDGTLLATAGLDAITKIWDVNTGTLLHNLEGPTESVECICWHSKGPILLSGGGDGVGWMWNSRLGKVMNVFTGHSASITDAKFTLDGKKLITTSYDKTIRIYDPKSPQPIHVIQEGSSSVPFHQEPIITFALPKDPESEIIVSGSSDGLACVLNTNTGKQIATYQGHSEGIESIDFSAGLPCVVTGSLDKTIKVWDINTLQTRVTLNHDDGIVKVACYASRPFNIFSCSLDGTIRVWDARTGTLVKTLKGHKSHVLSFEWIESKQQLVSVGEDTVIRFWDLKQL